MTNTGTILLHVPSDEATFEVRTVPMDPSSVALIRIGHGKHARTSRTLIKRDALAKAVFGAVAVAATKTQGAGFVGSLYGVKVTSNGKKVRFGFSECSFTVSAADAVDMAASVS